MMGAPVDDGYAEDCLKLWGLEQRYGGPSEYPPCSAFVLRARGIPIEWHSSVTETVGLIFNVCLNDEQKMIVKRYYEPMSDPRPGKHGVPVQCHMSLVVASFKAQNKKINRDKVNECLDRAIGKVRMALSYPSMVSDVKEEAKRLAA